jgi:histidine ammonia-lyase
MKPNVVKTSKFSVFETSFKSTAVYSKVQIESSTKKDKLITLSHGKRISLRDFSLVLYNDFDVSVDFPTNNTFPSISVDSTNVFVLTESSKNCTKSETIQSNLICRASLFVKLLNLVNISTDFDLNSIMALTAMLNNRIHPCLYSTESAGIDILSALYLSEKSSCYVNGAICPSKIALREILDSPIKLSKSEAKHIINSSFIGIATASLLGCGATRIMEMMDCIAALSCDVYGVQTEPYDANHFEVNRQQRGQINSSSNLRILLENSKRVNKPLSNDEIALEYFARIPQVHGPAIDYCTSAIKYVIIQCRSKTYYRTNC